MKFLKYFGWLIPVVIFGVIAIVTNVSVWVLGVAAFAVIILGYATGWLVQTRRQ